MSGPLNFDDLCRLSGRSRPSAVKRWLQDRGIRYLLDADRRPITSQKALDEAILRGRTTEPNWNIRS